MMAGLPASLKAFKCDHMIHEKLHFGDPPDTLGSSYSNYSGMC